MPEFHVQYERSLPMRRPEGFQPRVPRYSVRWGHPVPELVAEYFGLQGAALRGVQARDFTRLMREFLSAPDGPGAVEVMDTESDEIGRPLTVVVAYWTSTAVHARWTFGSAWRDWWESPARLEDGVGYWRETVVSPYDRHETVYSRPNYRAGFGRTPGAQIVEITNNGYFGAARDRIPLSAIDDLTSPEGPKVRREDHGDPQGRRVATVVPHNFAIMRSGQFWHDSEPDQAQDYEESLRPKLDTGMAYLADHDDLGCVYLRQLTNLDDGFRPRRETSVLCGFQEYSGLEQWAEGHPTHAAIFEHAIRKGMEYGPRRDVVTWHEFFIVPGGNLFEYVNCARGTGLTSVEPFWVRG
jgi:aldoxime dehydratase